jgi:hypothetical protein
MGSSLLVPTPLREHAVSVRSFVSDNPRSVEQAFQLNDVRRAQAAARDALRYSPLNSSALLILAMAANQNGDTTSRRRFDDLLDRVSKRDVGGQIWLVERALLERNFPLALLHINRALKTRPEMAAQIFPALTQVIRDPNFRSQLAREMTANVSWRADFLAYATADPSLAVPVAELYIKMPRLEASPAAETASGQLVKALAESGQFPLLRRIYPRLSGANGETATTDDGSSFYLLSGFAPINWEIPVAAKVTAAVSRPATRAGLDIEAWANAGYDGVATRKLLWLKPGTWSLSWARQSPSLSAGGSAHWEVECLTGPTKNQLARTTTLSQEARHKTLLFKVPASCEGIMLELMINGGDAQSSRIQLADVRLQPARPNTALH